MGKLTGFKKLKRKTYAYTDVQKRIKNFNAFDKPLNKKEIADQGARCMDCGTPFCHIGCPLGNIIPDFNHYVSSNDFEKAYRALRSTNNFPGFTGRICPAPCESSCVLAINKPAVAIKSIELAIALEAEKKKWNATAHAPKKRSKKKVAIIGSGPAGLACADQLNQAGHEVLVFERSDRIGGLLTYGIPNFKLEKKIVFAEIERLKKEGVKFVTKADVGKNIDPIKLEKENDALVLAIGSTTPRDLPLKNREANGIHFAMDFLNQATKKVLNKKYTPPNPISAKGKHVLVIGGGDTGSDCIGTSVRQHAKSITQIELLPKPPKKRDETMPWPQYDRIFRVSSSQQEGCHRLFSIHTKGFVVDEKNNVRGVEIEKIKWDEQKKSFEPAENSKTIILKADLILLALGFVHPENYLTKTLKVEHDKRGLISADESRYATNRKKIFVAGDARRGQSLVVWAISEGRECAKSVDEFLTKKNSKLSAKDYSKSDYHISQNMKQHTHYKIF